MQIKKILWPTDFSSNAQKALPYVQSLIEQFGAEVHVVYVVEEIAYHESWYGKFGHNYIHEIMDWAEESATRQLNMICDRFLDGCPLYIRHVAIGDPAKEILKLIEKEGVDMVVMASHGEKGNFPFGSVTEKVIKSSPVPVTTIPIIPDISA